MGSIRHWPRKHTERKNHDVVSRPHRRVRRRSDTPQAPNPGASGCASTHPTRRSITQATATHRTQKPRRPFSAPIVGCVGAATHRRRRIPCVRLRLDAPYTAHHHPGRGNTPNARTTTPFPAPIAGCVGAATHRRRRIPVRQAAPRRTLHAAASPRPRQHTECKNHDILSLPAS